MQQYQSSKERIRYLRKTIYKVHPKWKRRRVVRLLLLTLFIVSFIVVAILTLKEPRGALINVPYQLRDTYTYTTFDYVSQLIITELIVFLIPGLTYILYCYVLRGSCRGAIQWKSQESIFFTDTELRTLYSERRSYSNENMEISFPYADIKKIMWSECQQRFEIYGVSTRIHYIDYASDKVDMRTKNKENLKMPYHIQWIYPLDRLEEFKNDLRKATGLQIDLKTEASEES